MVVEQASAGVEERDLLIGETTVSGFRDIVSDETCYAYEIIFESYIAYSVLNESFACVDESEIYSGNLFRVYSKSNFLEYLKSATFASKDYPGEFKHYEIAALNHIVEIASVDAPQIGILRAPSNRTFDTETKEYEN
ncbi:MAG TPA: hypothetical protein VIL74_10330 [Pyrinomonadaceae bacterium]